ncbi:IS6 family transposase [Cupriavidus necator]|uniref:IS6 family transposase n=1 Tax=Cupriavidus necator TaxID=106590 RepID=UPI003F73E2A2
MHYPLEVMLTCMRWYVAYPLSLRHLEEMMAERGISVDQSTVHRWALKMLLPALNKIFRRSKRPVGKSWRMDETYILVRGKWKYLYRAVDKGGNTIDFLLRAQPDKAAARRFFEKAIAQHGQPDTVTIDGSASNLAALHDVNAERETPVTIRQVKYLNNIVEQDHRAIKRLTRPMLGKDFRCARILLGGIELMHMIAKGQMQAHEGRNPSAAEQFYSLGA